MRPIIYRIEKCRFFNNDEKVKDFPQFNCGLLIVTGLLAAACQTIDFRNSRSLFAIQLAFEAKELEFFEERGACEALKAGA